MNKAMDIADWKKSYNFQMFSIKDTLWVFHFDRNWYPADGKEWRKSFFPTQLEISPFSITFLLKMLSINYTILQETLKDLCKELYLPNNGFSAVGHHINIKQFT